MREREERKNNGELEKLETEMEDEGTMFVGNQKEDEDIFSIKNVVEGDVNDSQLTTSDYKFGKCYWN